MVQARAGGGGGGGGLGGRCEFPKLPRLLLAYLWLESARTQRAASPPLLVASSGSVRDCGACISPPVAGLPPAACGAPAVPCSAITRYISVIKRVKFTTRSAGLLDTGRGRREGAEVHSSWLTKQALKRFDRRWFQLQLCVC